MNVKLKPYEKDYFNLFGFTSYDEELLTELYAMYQYFEHFTRWQGNHDWDEGYVLRSFDADNMNTIKEISSIIYPIKSFEDEIKSFYLPCKRDKYTTNLDNRALITVLRQFLKVYNHDLQSREKFIKGVKYIVYKMKTQNKIFYATETKFCFHFVQPKRNLNIFLTNHRSPAR